MGEDNMQAKKLYAKTLSSSDWIYDYRFKWRLYGDEWLQLMVMQELALDDMQYKPRHRRRLRMLYSVPRVWE